MFECNVCKYESQWKHALTRHLKSKKHVDNVRKQEEDEAEAREQRKHFICNRCGKRFPKMQNLSRHENRVNKCVAQESQTLIQSQQINNNITNNNYNLIYNCVMDEKPYKESTYTHISQEFLEYAVREFDRGNLYINKDRDDEIRTRFRSLAMILSEAHWNIQYPSQRNLIVLSMLPWSDRKTSCEYFILEITRDNLPIWRSINIEEFRRLMTGMLATIQDEKRFNLEPIIKYVMDKLNESNIGIINKIIWEYYYRYMAERANSNKQYTRPILERKSNNDEIMKQYSKLVQQEATIGNMIPTRVISNFMLTQS